MAGAEFDPCHVLQMPNQTFCRPDVEAVAQILRRRVQYLISVLRNF